ncbi:retrovirus-related pol polyprotein from transposon TNT 1-94 [Tanacetum coccineum]
MKGWRLYDVESGNFFVSRDVAFMENEFPFKTIDDIKAYSGDVIIRREGGNNLDSNHTSKEQPGRGKRQRQPSTRLKDFVTHTARLSPSAAPPLQSTSSGTPYPIAHYVNCDKFSQRHRCFLAAITAESDPNTFAEAINDERWRVAMQKEIEALENNGTWTITDLPPGKKVITVAAAKNWELHQMDFRNAFLHGDLNEEVYMKIPPGFSSQKSGKVCRLQKSLYGLRQASRNWFAKLPMALKSYDFVQSLSDYSLFTLRRGNTHLNVLVYVDDLIISGNNSNKVKTFKAYLSRRFHMKNLGVLKYFLGIEVARNSEGNFLCQRKYALNIFSEAGLLGAKPANIPLEQHHRLTLADGEEMRDLERYRHLVGCLIYLTITRLELSYCVHVLSQFMQRLLDEYWQAIVRVVRYIKDNPGQGILLRVDNDLRLYGYCDSDWASCPVTRCSLTGYFVLYRNSSISWKTKKQHNASQSFSEAEYRSMATTTCELKWLKRLLNSLGVAHPEPMRLFCDNQAALHIAANRVFHERQSISRCANNEVDDEIKYKDDDVQEDAENEEDDNNEEDDDDNEEDDNEEDDNEEDADNEENSETKRRDENQKKKEGGTKMKKAEEENQVESEEDVLYEGRNSDDERLHVGMEKKNKKRTKKAKSSTSRSYMIKQSKNDIGGENNDSEEEQEDRKLTKDKMDEGLESESEGDEQLKKVTKPKKAKGSTAEKQYPTCNTRSSPKPMYEAMMTLSDPQKKCLKDMGFERMIHFPIVELPSALAYHAIDHFHPGSMELRLEKGSIKATRQKVQEMLGIPMGSRKLEDLEQRPFNDPFIKEWENQFKHVKKPTPAAIASVISDSTQADFMFRMNFITLFGSTMGTLDNGGRVSTKLLKGITEDIKWDPETRRLGKLEHHGEFNHEEEQDGINVYKGLDVYVTPINDKEPETKEEYYEKIVLKFDIISDVSIQKLVRTELFNDNEFKLYEYSKDDDSEGETDGDNEDNNHDDDGAPTTDANKKMKVKIKISEGTKENGSEATEGGSDGKEENMNGDEKEEKQDTNKDENDKVDNVQEKQADDKDEIGEDEFWNTQFTDSQCEELENQAIEEIKKKTTKRKTVIEMTPPSFSSCYLFSMEGSELDFIFETKEGNATIRDYMQTLAPSLKIESNVIDTYCLVLNHEQGVNSKRKKTKHFFHTGMIKNMFDCILKNADPKLRRGTTIGENARNCGPGFSYRGTKEIDVDLIKDGDETVFADAKLTKKVAEGGTDKGAIKVK